MSGVSARKPMLVLKIGSGLLFAADGTFDRSRIHRIAQQVGQVRSAGIDTLLVVSGAVTCGARMVDIGSDTARCVAATFGWTRLANIFDRAFLRRRILVAPVLLTADPSGNIAHEASVRQLLRAALVRGLVPILNEFDAVQLNGFGGNDLLAAKVALLMRAEHVLILSTLEPSPFGVGGGEAKRAAIALLHAEGISAEVVNGRDEGVILKVLR